MVPHKTAHGAEAMDRFKSFEGVPPAYAKVKKVVVPGALTAIRLMPGRKFTRLGDLAQSVGWNHGKLIEKLEAKRIAHGAAYHKAKLEKSKKTAKALEAAKAELAPINEKLAKFGY
jgi:large subunit ribosomal protein L13Ae